MKILKLLLALFAASTFCSCAHRQLSSNESAFLGQFHRTHVNYNEVKLYEGFWRGLSSSKIKLFLETGNDKNNAIGRPVTIAEAKSVLKGYPSAITLGNIIYFRKDFWMDDFTHGWPGSLDLTAAALLAHEITHVWQYQRRDLTGYSLAKVIAEHLRYSDPYQYEPFTPDKGFLEYRYEQQGQMVQDYVIEYYINPNGPRYMKLDSLIREVIPLHKILNHAGLIKIP